MPTKFVAANNVLVAQVPQAIIDLGAMISAAQAGNKDALVQATSVYVAEMEPTITNALDAIDTGVVHIR